MKIKDMTDDELRTLILDVFANKQELPEQPQPQPVATLCEAAEALMLFVDQHCNYHDLDPLLADCRRALTAEKKRQELVTNCINAYERLLKEITRDECRHPNADSFNGCYLCNAVGNAKTAKHRLDAHDKGVRNG